VTRIVLEAQTVRVAEWTQTHWLEVLRVVLGGGLRTHLTVCDSFLFLFVRVFLL
jgi:hypothetical protein